MIFARIHFYSCIYIYIYYAIYLLFLRRICLFNAINNFLSICARLYSYSGDGGDFPNVGSSPMAAAPSMLSGTIVSASSGNIMSAAKFVFFTTMAALVVFVGVSSLYRGNSNNSININSATKDIVALSTTVATSCQGITTVTTPTCLVGQSGTCTACTACKAGE